MRLTGDDALLHGPVNIPPVTDDMGTGLPPLFHDGGQFVLHQSHVQCAHILQRTNGSAVTKSQFCDFPLLPQMPVDAMFLHGNMEHRRRAGTINITVLGKHVLTPGLPSQPGDDPCFDSAEIGYYESASLSWDESRANQLLQYIRRRIIQKFQCIEITGAYQFPRFLQIFQMVLGQVLNLDQSSGKPPGPVGSVKLDESPGPSVLPYHIFHSHIFFDAGTGQFQPQAQCLAHFPGCFFDLLCYFLFGQRFHGHTLRRQPAHHLDWRVRVFQSRNLMRPLQGKILKMCIAADSVLHQRPVQFNAGIVNPLVEPVILPLISRYRKRRQPFFDGQLHLHIPLVILLESFPFIGIVARQVTGTAIVRLRRLAGAAEVFDEFLALCQFLFGQPEDGANAFQRQWQSKSRRPDHGTAPAHRGQVDTQVP